MPVPPTNVCRPGGPHHTGERSKGGLMTDTTLAAYLKSAGSAAHATQATDTIRIDARHVGPGRPTLVVAEIGVNHDGSVNKALELVRIAQDCGADAVKVQGFRSMALVHPSGKLAESQRAQVPADSPVDLLRRYELSGEDLAKIVKAVRE